MKYRITEDNWVEFFGKSTIIGNILSVASKVCFSEIQTKFLRAVNGHTNIFETDFNLIGSKKKDFIYLQTRRETYPNKMYVIAYTTIEDDHDDFREVTKGKDLIQGNGGMVIERVNNTKCNLTMLRRFELDEEYKVNTFFLEGEVKRMLEVSVEQEWQALASQAMTKIKRNRFLAPRNIYLALSRSIGVAQYLLPVQLTTIYSPSRIHSPLPQNYLFNLNQSFKSLQERSRVSQILMAREHTADINWRDSVDEMTTDEEIILAKADVWLNNVSQNLEMWTRIEQNEDSNILMLRNSVSLPRHESSTSSSRTTTERLARNSLNTKETVLAAASAKGCGNEVLDEIERGQGNSTMEAHEHLINARRIMGRTGEISDDLLYVARAKPTSIITVSSSLRSLVVFPQRFFILFLTNFNRFFVSFL